MLRRIREDDRVFEARAIQGGPDRGDLAVHHRARGDHVRARRRLADGRAGQELEGGVVVDPAAPHDPAVPVVRVLAEADVREDGQVGGGALHGPNRLLDHAVVRVGALRERILLARQAEEDDRRDAEGRELRRLPRDLLDRVTPDAREGRDVCGDRAVLANEQGLHEVREIRGGLADERPDRRVLSETPEPLLGPGD